TFTSDLRGLFRVDPERLHHANACDGVLLMTSLPDCAADIGAPLGVVKCAPVFLDARAIEAIEADRSSHGAVLEVAAFHPHRVAFVAPSERLRGNAFERATASLTHAVEWFGSSMQGVYASAADVSDVAASFHRAVSEGAELILAAGAAGT